MSRSIASRLRLFVVLGALGGASFAASFTDAQATKLAKQDKTGKKAKGKGAAPASTDECKADSDCVAVADDCCSCSQGGKQRAIPKKQKDAYEKERKKRCAETVCTEMVSTDPSCTQQPFCGAGICELGG
jgi:hypothetical protein